MGELLWKEKELRDKKTKDEALLQEYLIRLGTPQDTEITNRKLYL
jgi:hypothetical protein